MTLRVALDVSALDSTFKDHAVRGIGRYVQELRRNLRMVLANDASLELGEFDHRDFHTPPLIDAAIGLLPYGRQTIRQQIVYPLRLSGSPLAGYDLLHFPAHMDAPAWCRQRYVMTVLDLIPLVLPDLYRAQHPGWRFRFARWLELRAIRSATLLLAISENTARDLQRVLGISAERVVVTPLGVDEKFARAAAPIDQRAFRCSLNIPENAPIVLYVGGIDPRKNMNGLVKTFARVVELQRERGAAAPVLVIAGRIDRNREYPDLLALIAAHGIERQVLMPGFVTDEQLLQLYAASAVFFFPSLYEGFGFTPLEAMAAGAAVVSSNRSAMPEVLGEAALLVDPEDVAQCSEAIVGVMANAELAGALRDRGRRRAALFPWSRTAAATLDAYRRAAELAKAARDRKAAT